MLALRATRISGLGLTLVFALLSGCASIDYDYPRTESTALTDTDDTNLAQALKPIVDGKPQGHSGFLTMINGIDALAMRLMLAERAERSIDMQYYLIKNDIVGRAFIYSLLRAADRGVRVRLLVDDMFTAGMDVGVAALDSHPNFSIRIFNPFNRGALGRPLGAITSFNRINRRMHNKSFTVDNQITIIGGRNIADEYFGAREDAKFGDLDVLGVGPVVQDISGMFDTYWNHETALPALAFLEELKDPDAALTQLRSTLAGTIEDIRDTEYAEAVGAKFRQYLDGDGSQLRWAPYEVVVDSPDKGIKKRADDADSITTPLIASLGSAESEAIIVSPYFVPRKRGIEAFSALEARGVDVTVVTNSLAANNQFTVHAGYAGSRKPLLEAGVDIWEVRPDVDVQGAEIVAAVGAKATLHTKAFIIDRREMFIGSFNFDPRSANINTELGVIIRDPELARSFAEWAVETLPVGTYELFLNEDNKLRWRDNRGDPPIVFEKEPESSWWDRTKVGFIKILPVKSQL
jgi:putative cardiolipin synthase